MKRSSIAPVRLRFNPSFLQPFLFIVVIAVLLCIPYFLFWQPICGALYDSYVKEKCANLDTRIEYEIKLLGVFVLGIGVVGFFIQSWYQRLENRKFAFQRLIENEIKLIEYSKNDQILLRFFDSLDVEKKNKNTVPQHYAWYLAMAFTIWQQVFAYRMSGWIDRKTWRYWDRHLREVHIGQKMCSTDPYVEANRNDQIIRKNIYRYFLLWWQTKQNYRYYHVDFVRYINSIVVDIEKNRETKAFYPKY